MIDQAAIFAGFILGAAVLYVGVRLGAKLGR